VHRKSGVSVVVDLAGIGTGPAKRPGGHLIARRKKRLPEKALLSLSNHYFGPNEAELALVPEMLSTAP
jgi:hypothetical protein